MTSCLPVRVCVLGSINQDLVVRTPHLPRAGETLLGVAYAIFPGGKGANQAVAAARLGASVTLLACAGREFQGTELEISLQRAGVDTSQIITRDLTTGTAVITVDAQGENTIVVVPGANASLTARDVDARAGVITGAQLLLAQLEIPLAAVSRAAQIAHRAGVPVLLNAAPAMAIPAPLLRCVDVLIVNRGEASALVGAPAPSDLPSLVLALQARGPRQVLVTLGNQGAVLADGPGLRAHPAFPVEAIDATAAGDAFAAAFAVRWVEAGDAGEALRFACAAGALACARAGAQPSLPARAEVEALVSRR